jgi:hypothetical protein
MVVRENEEKTNKVIDLTMFYKVEWCEKNTEGNTPTE